MFLLKRPIYWCLKFWYLEFWWWWLPLEFVSYKGICVSQHIFFMGSLTQLSAINALCTRNLVTEKAKTEEHVSRALTDPTKNDSFSTDFTRMMVYFSLYHVTKIWLIRFQQFCMRHDKCRCQHFLWSVKNFREEYNHRHVHPSSSSIKMSNQNLL
jgi:hypothetical protein